MSLGKDNSCRATVNAAVSEGIPKTASANPATGQCGDAAVATTLPGVLVVDRVNVDGLGADGRLHTNTAGEQVGKPATPGCAENELGCIDGAREFD